MQPSLSLRQKTWVHHVSAGQPARPSHTEIETRPTCCLIRGLAIPTRQKSYACSRYQNTRIIAQEKELGARDLRPSCRKEVSPTFSKSLSMSSYTCASATVLSGSFEFSLPLVTWCSVLPSEACAARALTSFGCAALRLGPVFFILLLEWRNSPAGRNASPGTRVGLSIAGEVPELLKRRKRYQRLTSGRLKTSLSKTISGLCGRL